jgi:hypothetical protein
MARKSNRWMLQFLRNYRGIVGEDAVNMMDVAAATSSVILPIQIRIGGLAFVLRIPNQSFA